MYTAVVELNSLADPVWPAAQNNDLLFIRNFAFIIISLLKRGIEVWEFSLQTPRCRYLPFCKPLLYPPLFFYYKYLLHRHVPVYGLNLFIAKAIHLSFS